jgi:hypothetical protein
VIPSDEQRQSQLRPECNNYFQLFPTNRFVPLRPEQSLLKITKSRVQLGGGVPLPALATQLDGGNQLLSAVLAHDNGERIKRRINGARVTHAMR